MDSISGSNVFSVEPLVLLMKEVIQDEESREILQTKLIPMEYLLHHISTVLLQDQLPKAARETLKVWLQLLHNCLTDAKSILHHSNSRQRCRDCLSNNTGRASKQIKNWRVRFNYLFQALESDFLVFVRGLEAVIAPVIAPMIPLMEAVIEEEKYHILQSELRALHNLLLDVSAVFLHHQHKVAPERLKIWLRRLHGSLEEANSILHRFGPSQLPQRRLNCLIGNSGRCPQQLNEWKVLFNYLFQNLQTDFSMFVTSISHQIINRAPIPAMREEESVQQLSKDEAWELFRRIAFKENPVLPMDIEECAKNIADECKGFRLAIILIAAAMKGKNRVDEWETSLSSIKSHADSSSGPHTLHPKLYQQLRWCYDALPYSDLKNCFLYSAMYPKDEEIKVQELVQMWVAEGLVRSKQGDHLMDMAIGQSYVNLLVDRCFFQNALADENEYIIRGWMSPESQDIRVDHLVREMAVFIGEEEENCLFKAGQGLQNFPTIFHNEDCKRISVFRNDIRSLPAEFTCPKLVSLMLSENDSIEEVPPGFLVSLTSLKVLHLGDDTQSCRINSIPSSVGQLKQLEFLSLQCVKNIRDLPEEIGQLSSLQFLDLEGCWGLKSLPAKIGELQNLKYLNLSYSLTVIPQEIMCQLTSLTTLNAGKIDSSLEAESKENSIWMLKGLRNLTTLRIEISVKKGRTTSRIEDGIMGTWLDMRHLELYFQRDHDDVMVVHLPDDMNKMSKLQFFGMWYYRGSSLPDYICNFQHLEAIVLAGCDQLRELSSLERVPNLKVLRLLNSGGLKELGIGNSGGFLMLEQLVLASLKNLESIGGASNNGVWNESTLPRLRILAIDECPMLKRLPVGTDKLPNLSTIFGPSEWWRRINWEDGDMKIRLENLYKESKYWFS